MPLFDDDELPEASDAFADLPPLQGSEKQLGWSSRVRKHLLTEIGTLIRQQQALVQAHHAAGRPEKAEQAQAVVTQYIDAAGRWEREPSCRVWLDYRNNTAHDLLTDAPANPGSTWPVYDVPPEETGK